MTLIFRRVEHSPIDINESAWQRKSIDFVTVHNLELPLVLRTGYWEQRPRAASLIHCGIRARGENSRAATACPPGRNFQCPPAHHREVNSGFQLPGIRPPVRRFGAIANPATNRTGRRVFCLPVVLPECSCVFASLETLDDENDSWDFEFIRAAACKPLKISPLMIHRAVTEFLFNPQEAIVLREALGPRGRRQLSTYSAPGRDGEVAHEVIFRLPAARAYDRP